jgi:hypothetical protein
LAASSRGQRRNITERADWSATSSKLRSLQALDHPSPRLGRSRRRCRDQSLSDELTPPDTTVGLASGNEQ